jgi:NTE family protein
MSINRDLKELKAAQKAPIDFVTFSGGGAKGAIYSGVYLALKLAGTIDGVKFIAGSSAGAITAALVATGIDPGKFEELCKTTNLKGLLGNKGFIMINKDGTPLYELLQNTIHDNISKYLLENNIIEIAQSRFEQNLKEQVEIQNEQKNLKIEQEILEIEITELHRQKNLMDAPSSIKVLDDKLQLLESKKDKLLEGMKILEYDEKQSQNHCRMMEAIATGKSPEFEDLRQRCQENGPIYFKDLSILRALDPKKFKNLSVTSVRKDNGTSYIFSAEHTPNVDIALACRASASIPGVFAPVKIAVPTIVKDVHGLDKEVEKQYEFVDGGYIDNTPQNIKYFQSQDFGIKNITGNNKKVKSAIKTGRILAFAFGSTKEDDPVQLALYSAKRKIYNPGFIERFLLNILYKKTVSVGGDFQYTQTVENTFQELRHNALNIVPLDTPNIGTLSFAEANRKGEYLHIKGYMETIRHMDNHELIDSQDKLFEQKYFFLKIYEEVESPTIIKSWVQKISKGYTAKAEKLLSFCKSETFDEKDKLGILEEYIKLAATNRSSGKMDASTNTMKKLIESLNDPVTPTQIKTDFIAVLKGEKFLENPNQDIVNFKFTKNDFKKLLSKYQNIKKEKITSMSLLRK